MSDRSIASRPSLEQVIAIVDFMEKHPTLALGQLRGLEGRDESKRLWSQVTRIVNNISGPTRPMKSWVKYWADKKSSVRSKVNSLGGDPNSLSSNVEKKIWDLFLADDGPKTRSTPVKQESQFGEEPYFEAGVEQDTEPSLEFEDSRQEPSVLNPEERQLAIMDKLACEFYIYSRSAAASLLTRRRNATKSKELPVRAQSSQSCALSQLALASRAGARALERLAEAALIQARAIERLATTLEGAGAGAGDARAALIDIDATIKRLYSPT